MNCMKCGVELKNSGVFCEDCLADMKKYPVNPNATVHIPYRPAPAQTKKVKKAKTVKPDEQIRHLKKVRNWLWVLLIVTLLAFAASAIMVLHLSADDGNGILDIGQNYDTVDSTDGN